MTPQLQPESLSKRLKPVDAELVSAVREKLAENPEAFLLAAYGLIVDKQCGSNCNPNCPRNPYCLGALGRGKWTRARFRELNVLPRKDPNICIGIKNPSKMCYFNAIMQLWCHNPIIRSLFFNWTPLGEDDDCEITLIRKVFAHLMYTEYGTIKITEDIVKKLQVKKDKEQDPHEFYNKLLSKIMSDQDPLKASFQARLSATLYGRDYFETKCIGCGLSSKARTLDTWSDLQIHLQGDSQSTNLQDSLARLIAVEQVDTKNQYTCENCQCKMDVERTRRITELPEVLTLQVERTGSVAKTVVKLRGTLVYPDVLDLTPYVHLENLTKARKDTKRFLYKLTGLVCHQGVSARTGHYIALVCEGDVWYKCNDDKVEILDLEFENQTHSSKEVYLLQYTLVSKLNSNLHTLSPEVVKDLRELAVSLDYQLKMNIKQDHIAKIHRKALVEDLFQAGLQLNQPTTINQFQSEFQHSEYEFIPKDWLNEWIDLCKDNEFEYIDLKFPVINTTSLMCHHNKLAPPGDKQKYSGYKIIPSQIADKIYAEIYTTRNREPPMRFKLMEFLCKECVSELVELSLSRIYTRSSDGEDSGLEIDLEHVEIPRKCARLSEAELEAEKYGLPICLTLFNFQIGCIKLEDKSKMLIIPGIRELGPEDKCRTFEYFGMKFVYTIYLLDEEKRAHADAGNEAMALVEKSQAMEKYHWID